MAKNYKQLAEDIKVRINPENLPFNERATKELSTISYSDVLTYIRLAMKGVEPEYTRRSKEAGEKVKKHLSDVLNGVAFEYQGSVMTNTHIKGNSDIDLLVIDNESYNIDVYRVLETLNNAGYSNKYSQSSLLKLQAELDIPVYTGNQLEDLRNIRITCENKLTEIYKSHVVNKPKAIRINNLSLNREVDIVIANWYDDITSIINGKGSFRGICVYNKQTHDREDPDYPFLSIKRINERGTETNGRLKKMIRFLKNCKVKSDHDICLSSFDINAICYNIDILTYQTSAFYELVPVIYNQLNNIYTNDNIASNITSVDGREYVFRENNKKIQDLKLLLAEVQGILIDLQQVHI